LCRAAINVQEPGLLAGEDGGAFRLLRLGGIRRVSRTWLEVHGSHLGRCWGGDRLRPKQAALLSASAITDEVAKARGYRSAEQRARLAELARTPTYADLGRAPMMTGLVDHALELAVAGRPVITVHGLAGSTCRRRTPRCPSAAIPIRANR
jgi:hypothetical protein